MIQVKTANNTKYNTTDSSLELKCYMDQIASTENLREQLINQIYLITNIQQAINNNSIIDSMDNYLSKYNDSISQINGAILSSNDKLNYFDIVNEKRKYQEVKFKQNLVNKCKEVEVVFDQVAKLNEEAINSAKNYISLHQNIPTTPAQNININNAILANNV